MAESGTPTLVRVKRRRDEDPSHVLVLSAKKRKSSDPGEEKDVKILKLAGTIEQDDERSVADTVTKLLGKRQAPNFAELKEKYKKSSRSGSTLSDRSKAKNEEREESRYRLVNSTRAVQNEAESPVDDDGDLPPQSVFQLYDIVKEERPQDSKKRLEGDEKAEKLSCNGVEMIREYISPPSTKDNYVYDLYYAEGCIDNSEDFDDSLLDNLVSLQPFNTAEDFMYDEYRDDPSEFKFDDDEDSNDEDNNRNEYPDEDDYEGYCDESWDIDMRVRGLKLSRGIDEYLDDDAEEDGGDLSSDGGDDLLYTRSFEEDANSHGASYARFKQKILKEFREEELFQDEDEDEEDTEY